MASWRVHHAEEARDGEEGSSRKRTVGRGTYARGRGLGWPWLWNQQPALRFGGYIADGEPHWCASRMVLQLLVKDVVLG